MIKIILLVLASEALTAIGQVLFKKSVNSLGPHSLSGTSGLIRFMGEVVSKPPIWIGIVSMAAGLFVWLMALAQGDLSLVFPMGSVQYIMIMFMAHSFLGEKIDTVKFAGTFLVMLGIVLITIG